LLVHINVQHVWETWAQNIKMDEEIGCEGVDWIYLTHTDVQWRTL
jgi:hypothetical protein